MAGQEEVSGRGGYPGGHSDWPAWLAAIAVVVLVILVILTAAGYIKVG